MPLHVRITIREDPPRYCLALDLSEQQLRSRILEPYFAGGKLVIEGETIDAFSVRQLRVNETAEESEELLPIIDEERRRDPVVRLGLDSRWFVTERGRDRTKEFVDREVGADLNATDATQDDLELVVRTCRRLPMVARQLQRRHQNRTTLELRDEYDVQDLLHSLLLLHFDDVRDESSNPTYLGKGSRIDLLLPAAGIAIEVKLAGAGLRIAKLGSELAEDIVRYADPGANRGAITLVIYIHDPSHAIANPVGFEADLGSTNALLRVVPVITH